MNRRLFLICLLALTARQTVASSNAAFKHLDRVMDRYHKSFDVFTDLSSGGNHFAARCLMFGDGGSVTDVTFDESVREGCRSGSTCIENTFAASVGLGWAGMYFQNGVLGPTDTKPKCNWGTTPEAGFDLTGQVQLSFWARGAEGGEKIEFFVGGIGYDPVSGMQTAPFPDSLQRTPKLGKVTTLSRKWKRYRIRLRGKNKKRDYRGCPGEC